MSFYFDDDNNNNNNGLGQTAAGGGGLKIELDEDNFLCDNCGGTDSYLDTTTGNLFCSSCFTQSQTIMATQEEEGLDYEEVMGMAARTKGGHIIHTKQYDMRKGRKKKKPLEDFDKSQPLPDLKKCISGFQTVLREGAKCIGGILEMDEEEQKAYLNTIRSIWMTFLRAWSDGAETYGSLYPTMRFSLRDCFLSRIHRAQIKLVLELKAEKELEAELKKQEKENPEGDEIFDDDYYESNQPEPIMAPESFPSSVQAGDDNKETSKSIVLRGRKVRNIRQLANCFPKGREEAALSLNVSLELATALLWIPIARIGIIPGQIINWIANGSLPFVNAFDNLLSKEEQGKLNLIKVFFRMDKPPKASAIEKKAANLVVAAGLKSPSSLAYGIHSERISRQNDTQTTSSDEGQAALSKNVAVSNETTRRIRFVSADCVPIMIGRLVADLGLGQPVLDIALSLTGIQPAKNPKAKDQAAHQQWLPPPLKQAHPDWVDSPEYALAIIVVACKMCPGWDKWSFYTSSSSQQLSEPPHEKTNADSNKNESPQSKSSNHKFKARSIPWNEEQFRLVRNDTLKDYLDFFEESVRPRTRRNGPRFEALVSALENHPQKHVESAGVRSNTKLESGNRHTEILLPSLVSLETSEARKLHRGFAQGFFPYISYPNCDSHTTKKQHSQSKSNAKKLTQEPFHPFYIRLIEYMAYKTHVDAISIHEIVSSLDEEVVALCEGRNIDDDDEEEEVHSPQKKRAKTSMGLPSLGVMLNPANSFARYTTYKPLDQFEVQREQVQSNSPVPDIHIPEASFDFDGIFNFGGSVQPEARNEFDAEEEEEVIQYAEV